MQPNCKCCEGARELAKIMAGIATGKYTIEDLKNAMRKTSHPDNKKQEQK